MNIKETPNIPQKQRELNIELLRIFSMFLVLLIHYVQSTTNVLQGFYQGGVIYCVSVICVNCFILISGYFGIKWKKKSFFNLVFQITFWYIFAAIVAIILFKYDFISALKSLTSVSERWFIVSYLGLYTLAPILNAFIEKTSEKGLLLILIAFYSWSTLFGYLGKSPDVNEGMSCLSLVGLYMLGAYLRKASWIDKYNSIHFLFLYIMCVLSLACISVLLLKLGIKKSPLGYLNPIVIVESCALFLVFKAIVITKGTKIILFISSSVFAAYLFHTHSLIYPHFCNICDLCENSYHSTLLGMIFLLTVFVFSIIIDKVRQWLFKYILV